MSTQVTPAAGSALSELNEHVVEEVRVLMTRRRMTQATLAGRLHVNQVWVSRRIGVSHDVALTLDEVEWFAGALSVPTMQLLPRLDSNQEPSVSRPPLYVVAEAA